MKQLLIVAHIPSENTRVLRDAVLSGATHSDIDGVETRALTPFEAGPDDVRAADAIILGTTENLGYMSGALKDFFDRTYYAVLGEKQGLRMRSTSEQDMTAPARAAVLRRLSPA